MIAALKTYCIVLFLYFIFAMATSDVLDTERSSFLGFTHEIDISPSTLELVEQLTKVIFECEQGDRRVRRYFEHYETPFVGDKI